MSNKIFYQDKYLKYKKKYLELKNQYGGNFDCKKNLFKLRNDEICEENSMGTFLDMQSCITSERCNNKWKNANSLINNIITNPFFKFDTLKDAVKFKNSNKNTKDNLVTIYLNELIIYNINEYTALNNFETIYVENVIIQPREFFNINFSTFFEKVQNIHKLTIDKSFGPPIELNSLPQSLTHLTLSGDFNQQIGLNILPQTLTHLTLSGDFNQPIGLNILPQTLTHLTFGGNFNQQIGLNVLPPYLTHLTLYNYNYSLVINIEGSIKSILPQSLISLYLNTDQPIDQGTFLNIQSLTYLTLGDNFDHSLAQDVLPQSLTHLTFGQSFNQPIGLNVLPQSLTHLTFGNSFNEALAQGVLPQSLTHLTFGHGFNHSIDQGSLPSNLIFLSFDPDFDNKNFCHKQGRDTYAHYVDGIHMISSYDGFNQEIGENVLPTSLTHLIFSFNFDKPLGNSLRRLENLTNLAFGCKFNKSIEIGELPINLTHLILGKNYEPAYNESVWENDQWSENQIERHYEYSLWCFNQPIKVGVLPQSLTHLTFSVKFNQEIDANVLPRNLSYLTFGSNFNKPIRSNVLPQTLTHLMFGNCFNQQIEENLLPQSLTNLVFSSEFNKPIRINVLPQNLTHLVFGNKFNHKIRQNVIPQSLKYLIFSNDSIYNHELNTEILSNNLTHLYLGQYFNEPIILPQSLTHLVICNKEHDQLNLLNNKFSFKNEFNEFNEYKYCFREEPNN